MRTPQAILEHLSFYVNGIKADDSKKTYWAIYVNGDYSQYGADSQPVNDGDAYALRLEL